jgi:hypothetical protein
LLPYLPRLPGEGWDEVKNRLVGMFLLLTDAAVKMTIGSPSYDKIRIHMDQKGRIAAPLFSGFFCFVVY